MRKSNVWLDRAAPLVLGTGLLLAYLATLAPGLTWANGGSDGGDLIAAAATGGVAHPTGYPVYLLLARLFQWLPVGSLAYRTNLLSAVSTAIAALLVYATVRRGLKAVGPTASVWGALVGGLALGLAPLVWSQAVIAEVYGLGLFFVALLLYLLTWPSPWSSGRVFLVGLVQGVAAGNQILAILLAPATLWCVAFRHRHSPDQASTSSSLRRQWSFEPQSLVIALCGLLVGLLIYLDLPLRAASHPPVNWGDPVAVDRFFWLISANLYQGQLIHVNLASSLANLRAWAALTLQAYGVVGLIAGAAGLVLLFKPERLHVLTLWIAAVFTAFAIQYEVVDSNVYLLPAFLAFAVWIGLGVGGATDALARYLPRAKWTLGVAGVGYLILLGIWHAPQVNAAQDFRAEQFGQYVMSGAPRRALVFTRSDRVVLGLRYFHYALHERPDLALIANDLLPFDWYRGNLRHTYPDLVIPAPSTELWLLALRSANPERPACYIYSADEPLNCQ